MATALLTNKGTDGDGTEYLTEDGGFKILRLFGTFDGATVTLKTKFGLSATYNSTSDTWTSEDSAPLVTKTGMWLKLTISRAGASTDISAEII